MKNRYQKRDVYMFDVETLEEDVYVNSIFTDVSFDDDILG